VHEPTLGVGSWTAPAWHERQSAVPKVPAPWHLLHVDGTGGKFMPVWHDVQSTPSWLFCALAVTPS
jgi:hypothetical protein